MYFSVDIYTIIYTVVSGTAIQVAKWWRHFGTESSRPSNGGIRSYLLTQQFHS